MKLKSQEQCLKELKFERKVFAFFGFVTVLLLAFLIYFAKDLKEEGTHKLGKLQNIYGELKINMESCKINICKINMESCKIDIETCQAL